VRSWEVEASADDRDRRDDGTLTEVIVFLTTSSSPPSESCYPFQAKRMGPTRFRAFLTLLHLSDTNMPEEIRRDDDPIDLLMILSRRRPLTSLVLDTPDDTWAFSC